MFSDKFGNIINACDYVWLLYNGNNYLLYFYGLAEYDCARVSVISDSRYPADPYELKITDCQHNLWKATKEEIFLHKLMG